MLIVFRRVTNGCSFSHSIGFGTRMSLTHNDAALGRIKLLSLDVDGVLTDGGIYYADDGNTYRKFNAKDGMGLVHLMKSGIQVTLISAGAPGAIEHRAKRLGIEHVFTNIHDKLTVLRQLCDDLDINMEDVAHMGDDINDLSIMDHVGLSITVADAVDAVLQVADITTKRKGGEGAVREICDAVIRLNTPA